MGSSILSNSSGEKAHSENLQTLEIYRLIQKTQNFLLKILQPTHFQSLRHRTSFVHFCKPGNMLLKFPIERFSTRQRQSSEAVYWAKKSECSQPLRSNVARLCLDINWFSHFESQNPQQCVPLSHIHTEFTISLRPVCGCPLEKYDLFRCSNDDHSMIVNRLEHHPPVLLLSSTTLQPMHLAF